MTIINVGLCAYGFSGKIFHQPFIKHHPGFHLHAVLERSKADSLADNPDVIIYRSLDELLADAAIGLVVVNTPNYLHYEYAKKALEAGKHVVVEKPFTATVAEATELLGIAEEQGKFITVYHNRRYDSDFLTVKKIVGEGNLGEIIEAEFRFDRYKPAIGPKRFKEEAVPASGFLYDLGSHLTDQAVALFGRPTAVYADCRKVRKGTAVIDFFEVVLHYGRAMRVRLLSGQVIRHPSPGFVLHGSLGSFLIERSDRQEELLIGGMQPVGDQWLESAKAKDGLLDTETNAGNKVENIPGVPGNYMDYYDAVYNSIASNKSFPISSDEIVDVIAIIEAANRSSATGQLITLQR